jgi:transposase-like protein
LATQAGDVERQIPKLRKGSFFPVILEPRRRIDQALYAVVMKTYVHGVYTRSVDDLGVAWVIACCVWVQAGEAARL